MEGRLNEGGDPGFLVHGDLVWTCGDKAARLQIQFNARIICLTTFTLTHTGTQHILCTARFIFVCLGLCISVLSTVIKARQSHPELSEDVAKAHNLLETRRPVLIG